MPILIPPPSPSRTAPPGRRGNGYPQDVAFLQFDIHYEVDSLGSEQEYIKA